jgi:hypothetical protein
VLRNKPQRQLAERGQVGVAKKVLPRDRGAFRHVNFAFGQPLPERFRREIDELDLIGARDHGVGHGLMNGGTGDLPDGIRAAFDVLHVQGREYVDAGIEQLHDVLVAFGVARARGVGVRELVDQHQLRPAGERRFEVELGQRDVAVRDHLARQAGQTGEQRFGFLATVRLDETDQHVDAIAPLRLRRLEHRVRLAHARAHAEEDLQPATPGPLLLALERGEQRVGTGAGRNGHGERWQRSGRRRNVVQREVGAGPMRGGSAVQSCPRCRSSQAKKAYDSRTRIVPTIMAEVRWERVFIGVARPRRD